MTEESLKKGTEINSMLKNEISKLINTEHVELGAIGACLLSLMDKDKEFKDSFVSLLNETKDRLEKEFNEL